MVHYDWDVIRILLEDFIVQIGCTALIFIIIRKILKIWFKDRE